MDGKEKWQIIFLLSPLQPFRSVLKGSLVEHTPPQTPAFKRALLLISASCAVISEHFVLEIPPPWVSTIVSLYSW